MFLKAPKTERPFYRESCLVAETRIPHVSLLFLAFPCFPLLFLTFPYFPLLPLTFPYFSLLFITFHYFSLLPFTSPYFNELETQALSSFKCGRTPSSKYDGNFKHGRTPILYLCFCISAPHIRDGCWFDNPWMSFLSQLLSTGTCWSASVFHYRRHILSQ